MTDLSALVSFIVSSLVTKPDQVTVTTSQDDHVLQISIGVAPEDTGRVIGRRGATIGAIRQILRISASRTGQQVEVDVQESE